MWGLLVVFPDPVLAVEEDFVSVQLLCLKGIAVLLSLVLGEQRFGMRM